MIPRSWQLQHQKSSQKNDQNKFVHHCCSRGQNVKTNADDPTFAHAEQKPSHDPTAQQRAASDPAVSVWVNASAGSGKTHHLDRPCYAVVAVGDCRRSSCASPLPAPRPRKWLCALREKLSHWAVCSDNDLNASLGDLQGPRARAKEMMRARRLFAETLACPGGMRIRTLHAFGQEILRRFPIESGLPPHFAVIEEDDASALQDDVLTGFCAKLARNPDHRLRSLVAILIDGLGEKAFREHGARICCAKKRKACRGHRESWQP